MSDDPAERHRRLYRVINAVFWTGAFAFAVFWTDSWGQWVAMFLEACVPLLLGCYIHLVLRPGGTGGEA